MKMIKEFQPARSCLYSSTIENMIPQVTIDGVTGDTVFYALGNDATIVQFPVRGYGTNLPIASTGNDPLIQTSTPFFGAFDKAVQFNQYGKVYRATSNLLGDFGGNDFHINLLVRTSSVLGSANNKVFLAKRAGASTTYWSVHEYNSQTAIVLYVVKSALTRQITFSGLMPNSWYCIDIMFDMSVTTLAYAMGGFCNGVQLGVNAGSSSAFSTLTNTELLTVGAMSDLTSKNYDSKLARVSIATKSGWFPGGTDNATVWLAYHKENVARLSGLNTVVDSGSSVPAYSRDYIEVIENKGTYHQIGDNLVPISQKSNGTRGAILQEYGSNNCLDSTDMSTWTGTLVTTPTSVASPVDGFLAYTARESTDGAPASHFIGSPVYSWTEDTNGRLCFLHLLIAADVRPWVYAAVVEGGSTQHTFYYNISTQVLGTTTGRIVSAEVVGQTVYSGKTFKHIIVRFTSVGGTGNKRVYLYPANNTPTYSYQGNSSDCFTLAQIQWEITNAPTLWYKFDEPSGSSLIDWSGNALTGTISGTVVRTTGVHGSALQFDGTTNYIDIPVSRFNQRQGMWCCWVKADWDAIGATHARVFNSTDSRGGNYMFRSYCAATGSAFFWYAGNGTGYVGASAGPSTNDWMHVLFTWEYGGVSTIIRGYQNGSYVGSATLSGMISVPDLYIRIGWWQSTAGAFAGEIDDFRLWGHVISDINIAALPANRARFQKNPGNFLVTTTAPRERTGLYSVEYPYSNASSEGSKSFTFRRAYTPSAFCIIWRIAQASARGTNSIFGFIDEYGYINAEVKSSGVVQGTIQLAQNICDDSEWQLGFRWQSDVLHILAYSKKTGITYTTSGALSAFPSSLDVNEVISSTSNSYMSECKDYDYYESDNRRLLFG